MRSRMLISWPQHILYIAQQAQKDPWILPNPVGEHTMTLQNVRKYSPSSAPHSSWTAWHWRWRHYNPSKCGELLTQQHSLISYETSHCRLGRLVNCTGDCIKFANVCIRFANVCSEMITGVNVLCPAFQWLTECASLCWCDEWYITESLC